MKIYLVQGRHPSVPGNPMLPFLSLPAANVAARDLVNTILLDEIETGTGDDPITFTQGEGEFDWLEKLVAYQKARILADIGVPSAYDELTVEGMGSDQLAEESDCDVYISELEIADAPDAPAALEELCAAGQAATEFLFDANDPAATAAGQRLADALQVMRWAAIWQGNVEVMHESPPCEGFTRPMRGLQPSELAAMQGFPVGVGEALGPDRSVVSSLPVDDILSATGVYPYARRMTKEEAIATAASRGFTVEFEISENGDNGWGSRLYYRREHSEFNEHGWPLGTASLHRWEDDTWSISFSEDDAA